MMQADSNPSSFSRSFLLLVIVIYTVLVLFLGLSLSQESRVIQKLGNIVKIGPSTRRNYRKNHVDNFPRMIITGPCSGSSISIQVAKYILEAHGYDVVAGKEPSTPRRNKFYNEAVENLWQRLQKEPTPSQIVAESFRIINENTKKRNKILLIKLSNIREDMLQPLQEMGAKYAFTYRDNVLDRAVCVTRDCFQKNKLGYQVFSNGTQAELCFDRRQSKDKIFAYINNTDAMIDFMNRLKTENEKRLMYYRSYVTPAEMWSYEDLFDFEYTDSNEAFDKSVQMWSSFLRNFAEINQTKVEEVLSLYRNTRSPPSPHSDVIYNIGDVKKALLDRPDLKRYLRE
mmetsp:Transcript_4826/g.9206  ORF Transcript_4826/g.9206 Transcript_4826/m.9206 type:complete len:342 (-) Transcript_4826:106-1131(-)